MAKLATKRSKRVAANIKSSRKKAATVRIATCPK